MQPALQRTRADQRVALLDSMQLKSDYSAVILGLETLMSRNGETEPAKSLTGSSWFSTSVHPPPAVSWSQ